MILQLVVHLRSKNQKAKEKKRSQATAEFSSSESSLTGKEAEENDREHQENLGCTQNNEAKHKRDLAREGGEGGIGFFGISCATQAYFQAAVEADPFVQSGKAFSSS